MGEEVASDSIQRQPLFEPLLALWRSQEFQHLPHTLPAAHREGTGFDIHEAHIP